MDDSTSFWKVGFFYFLYFRRRSITFQNLLFAKKASKRPVIWASSWVYTFFLLICLSHVSSILFLCNLVPKSNRTSKPQARFFIVMWHTSKEAFENLKQISIFTSLNEFVGVAQSPWSKGIYLCASYPCFVKIDWDYKTSIIWIHSDLAKSLKLFFLVI